MKWIVEYILDFLESRSPFSCDEDRQKAEYILTVFINEMFKSLLLFIIFALMGKGKEFIAAFIIILITRSFAGGLHEKSNVGCFIHSFMFFLIVLYISEEQFILDLRLLIYTVTFILILVFAPWVPKERGIFNKNKRRKLKVYSICGLMSACAGTFLFKKMSGVITASILAEMVEFTILVFGKEVKKHVGDIK